jgi:hypothetical protein
VIHDGFEPRMCKVGTQEVAAHRRKCDRQKIDNDPGCLRVRGLDGLRLVAAEASGTFADLIELEWPGALTAFSAGLRLAMHIHKCIWQTMMRKIRKHNHGRRGVVFNY